MTWLVANLFLLFVIGIAAGFMWLVAFCMWSMGMAPDDHPAVLSIGILLALVATYFVCKRIHRFVERHIT